MSYLVIELAHTIDEDRHREAARCRRINKALVMRQKQSINPIPNLVHWLHSLMKQDRHVVTEPEARALAKLS